MGITRDTEHRHQRYRETDLGIEVIPKLDAPTLIRQAGLSLYGSRWQAELARALDVNIRTIRRWTSGQDAPRPRVWTEIRNLAQHRRAELAELIGKLEP